MLYVYRDTCKRWSSNKGDPAQTQLDAVRNVELVEAEDIDGDGRHQHVVAVTEQADEERRHHLPGVRAAQGRAQEQEERCKQTTTSIKQEGRNGNKI